MRDLGPSQEIATSTGVHKEERTLMNLPSFIHKHHIRKSYIAWYKRPVAVQSH